MFQQRRQAALGNINLGNLSGPPGHGDLTFLLEQASRYRGRFVEIAWAVAKTGATFQLTAKYLTSHPEPSWMLYRGIGGSSELVWGHNSNDLTLMHNLIMLECEKPVDGGNSISAGAMDSMMTTSRAAGSVAAPPSDGKHSSVVVAATASSAAGGNHAPPPSLNEAGAAQAAAFMQAATRATTPASAPQIPAHETNPAATWLQNLSYGRDGAMPDTPVADANVPAADGHTAFPSSSPYGETAAATTAGDADLTPNAAAGAEMLLDGSLNNITVPKLLRYLANNGSTGRLALQGSISAAEIFYKAGALTHAATLESKGEHALLDVATWVDGEFHFDPEEQTAQHTINGKTADIIIACERMLEFSKFLSKSQLRPNSFLIPQQQLSRVQFEKQVQNQATGDVQQIWRVYEQMDGNRCLSDILRVCPMTRAEWIPVVYSLINSGVAAISDRPLEARPGMFLEGAPVDQAAIERFMQTLWEATDNIVKRDAFLYFLQQEQHRFERTGAGYALVLFSFASTNMLSGNMTPFTPEQMKEAAERISKAKRRLDIVGHFDEGEYGLLLPETDSAGAAVFANRITRLLKKPAIVPETADQMLVVSFGVASVPGDVRDLAAVISAARAAKSRSKLMGSPLVMYGDA